MRQDGMGMDDAFLRSSPIVFVIYLREEEVVQLDEFLRLPENSILCEPRIRLLILRNLGIHNVHTSHMIVLDMDMWMSSGD